jgi:hypothetical protein
VAPLAPDLYGDLDRAVVRARDTAEEGARAAIAVLGVEVAAAPTALSQTHRDLRTALRARGRSIGGGVLPLGIDGLVEEIAYEQWHRMLFARFLAENGLLLHPGGAAVSMAEVAALAAEEGERDQWVLAARYAAAMLPGIFRADDPAHQVRFAAEHRTRLEAILAALPAELFRADDALGWVYQFWQSKRKKEVNDSGRKIGWADLPPVTQLFTEHYMVRFLLENSLGAWWAGRHPKSRLLRDWEYLRFRDDGIPAAGTFEGWPERAAEITVMDPCMGSGHFLVAAADMLRAMRMEEEGLPAADAASAVLRDNLFGLELDPRCTQLGAFALAFDAWKVGGYQQLPVPNIACSGIAVKGQLDDWRRLAGDDTNMADALERLYALFQDAPELGSLIDPTAAAGDGLWRVDTAELQAKLESALANERNDPAAAVFGAAAEGTAKAARLLSGRYWLVATNPPFLGVKKADTRLATAMFRTSREGRFDLATALLVRWLRSGVWTGSCAFVTPANWYYLGSYSALRHLLLSSFEPVVVVLLGQGFEASGADIGATIISSNRTQTDSIMLVDVPRSMPSAKGLLTTPVQWISSRTARADNEGRLLPARVGAGQRSPLEAVARSNGGMQTSDEPRFIRFFWEIFDVGHHVEKRWLFQQNTVSESELYGGREHLILWEDGKGSLFRFIKDWEAAGWKSGIWKAGSQVWGRDGVLVSLMGSLQVTTYSGGPFHKNTAALVPSNPADLAAVWTYCQSPDFNQAVRAIDRSLKVTSSTIAKVPFDLEHWTKVAAEQYPDGLPEPHSDDPTQWLFKGVIPGSTAPLQVPVARLLGYRWPDQEPDDLDEVADDDGIVPLPSVRGETPAAERLRAVLARAYGSAWSPALLDRLLADAGSPGATLESWLRDDFFAQHARLFGNRPFIWQVWDGRKDGFSVLLNYHRLDGPALEKLTYTYLNDWIERQKGGREEPAAEARLVAALELQGKLKQILDGEPPFDIYIRWKSLVEQPIGWQPDLDDGVRLNIRPFVLAGILRAQFTIHWPKDRGANPDGSERLNDLHHTRAEKLAARKGTS